jgi:hypothetical protein
MSGTWPEGKKQAIASGAKGMTASDAEQKHNNEKRRDAPCASKATAHAEVALAPDSAGQETYLNPGEEDCAESW